MGKKKKDKGLLAFRRRLRKHYAEAPQWPDGTRIKDGTNGSPRNSTAKAGAVADGRSLDGSELAARKAELEARGLPPTKIKPVVPSFRGKKTRVAKSQLFFPSRREARRNPH